MKAIPRSVIPNSLTLANLLCGAMSMVWSSYGDLLWAGLFIFLSIVLDFLDGMTARLLKATSEFGKQLDSLSDMVSFGLAPSFLLFYLDYEHGFKWFNLLAFAIALGAAIRLAKFNIDPRQETGFIGLPTPAMASLVACLPFIIEYDNFGITSLLIHPAFVMILPILGMALMVSEIKLFSLKFKNLKFEENKIRFAFLVIAVALLALFQFAGIPMIIFTYILLSLIRNFAA